MNIMLVEDDEGLSRGIPLALLKEGDRFFPCGTVREARELLKKESIDMILLDIGLPDGDGLSLCREIRKEYDMPILFLTANDMEYEEVAGLDAGADDYITKPFSLAVLRSRIDAARRRMARQPRKESGIREENSGRREKGENGGVQEKGGIAGPGSVGRVGREAVFLCGPYCFDFENLRFSREEEEIFLSRTEQRLLHVLVTNREQIIPREVLLDKIWGLDGSFLEENALSVTVGRLRSKLQDGKEGEKHLQTVYGIGYVWRMEPWKK